MRTKTRQRVDQSEMQWRKVLGRLETSGRNQEAFCRESGIPATTLQFVRRRSIEIEFPDGTIARVRS